MKKNPVLRNCCLLFFFAAVYSTIAAQVIDAKNKLKLVGVKQLELPGSNFPQYELSGMSCDENGSIVTIDDYSNKICKIDTSTSNRWKLIEIGEVKNRQHKTNFEAITVKDGHVYIASEKPPCLLSEFKNGNLHKLPVNHQKIESLVGSGNVGIEAIAFDSEGKRLYFADEASSQIGGLYKNPVIYSTLLNGSQSSVDTFFRYNETDDISDMAIYKSHLFVLKRFSCKIEKWRLSDKTLVESRSFKSLLFKDGKQKLYGNQDGQFGLAEALLIKDGKIFIGLDNGNIALNVGFLKENKGNILTELSANESHFEASNFKNSKEPILFVFEASGFVD